MDSKKRKLDFRKISVSLILLILIYFIFDLSHANEYVKGNFLIRYRQTPILLHGSFSFSSRLFRTILKQFYLKPLVVFRYCVQLL